MTRFEFPRGRLFWKLFLFSAVIMATLLVVCVWAILTQFERFHEEDMTNHLRAQARAMEVAVRDRFDRSRGVQLDALAKEVASSKPDDVRITFVLADGTVLGDSVADPAQMESHRDRPEIRDALLTGWGESTRWSRTVQKDLKYVAVSVGPAGDPVGVVRVAMAVRTIGERIQPTRRLISIMAAAAVLAAILLALGIALLWSRRITRITIAARNISEGDLTSRVEVGGRDEVAKLAESLNQMRERLSAHLDMIDRQRRTLDALMAQLREGVVVADGEGRIVLINPEARRQLQLAPAEPEGWWVNQPVERCVPLRALQGMLLRSGEGEPARGPESGLDISGAVDVRDIEIREVKIVGGEGSDRSLLARAFDVLLPDFTSGPTQPATRNLPGRVLVLADTTELAALVQVKADFAANASHELRTPLATIRASLETLRGVNSVDEPAAAERFLDVIERQCMRMEAMVTDLLDLSRLETPSARFPVESVRPLEILEELRVVFAQSLAAKSLEWKVDIEPDCETIRVNPDLLRIVLRNLIDNAVRFTDTNGRVGVSVLTENGNVIVRVVDDGCGIPERDQSRVFERFYQVEVARSGSDRGTGLGLSIVRHAVAAMRGRVELESETGCGTTVTAFIPQHD